MPESAGGCRRVPEGAGGYRRVTEGVGGCRRARRAPEGAGLVVCWFPFATILSPSCYTTTNELTACLPLCCSLFLCFCRGGVRCWVGPPKTPGGACAASTGRALKAWAPTCGAVQLNSLRALVPFLFCGSFFVRIPFRGSPKLGPEYPERLL